MSYRWRELVDSYLDRASLAPSILQIGPLERTICVYLDGEENIVDEHVEVTQGVTKTLVYGTGNDQYIRLNSKVKQVLPSRSGDKFISTNERDAKASNVTTFVTGFTCPALNNVRLNHVDKKRICATVDESGNPVGLIAGSNRNAYLIIKDKEPLKLNVAQPEACDFSMRMDDGTVVLSQFNGVYSCKSDGVITHDLTLDKNEFVYPDSGKLFVAEKVFSSAGNTKLTKILLKYELFPLSSESFGSSS